MYKSYPPISYDPPLFNVQGIHAHIKEDKDLGDKRQSGKRMPTTVLEK